MDSFIGTPDYGALQGKRVLLIIGGGVAAYKSLELARRLMDHGVRVRGVLTHGGAQFITPLSVASLTGDQCFTDLFDLKDEAEMGHIRLSREADVILVCPATADLMAKMAQGLAGDLASTVLLATDKPVLIAPAMNAQMWDHPATQRNLATLAADGIEIIAPAAGMLACGEVGTGRLADIADIISYIAKFFARQSAPKPLMGKHIIITAGPTYEAIDPIRYIANRSSGKQGYALAASMVGLGARVTLVSGPVELATPAGVTRLDVQSAREMHTAVFDNLPADAALCVAAVADWHVVNAGSAKMKKTTGGLPDLKLAENPDILADICASPQRPDLVVGFAAETHNVLEYATAKRARKGCDLIIANDVALNADGSGVMGGDRNKVHVIDAAGTTKWAEASKSDIADKIAQLVADHLAAKVAG